MKSLSTNSLTLSQYIFIINGIQVGTGVLSLPRQLAVQTGADGWISLLIGWVGTLLASICFLTVAQKHPHTSTQELLCYFFGPVFSRIILFLYCIYFLFYYWIVMLNTMLFTKSWFLPNTSDYWIMFLFSIPTYMLVSKGLQAVGRYCELSYYLVMWIPVIFIIPFSTHGSWLHFLPILKEGLSPILQAFPTTNFTFLGFEICFFLYPYLQQKKQAIYGSVIATTLTMLFYLLLTFCCFYTFSPDAIIHYTQPVLSLLKLIEFPFIERFDLVVLSAYLIIPLTSWSSFLQGILLIKNPLETSHSSLKLLVFILGCGILAVIIFHPSWSQSEKYQQIVSYTGGILAYLFPLFLWMYSKVKFFIRKEYNQNET